jgi:hypothetical protein
MHTPMIPEPASTTFRRPTTAHGHDGARIAANEDVERRVAEDFLVVGTVDTAFGGARDSGWTQAEVSTCAMHPLRLIETTPGRFSLLLVAGMTQVDELIEKLGHEPNGYFWEGVAQLLVRTQAPELGGRFEYDPEGGMFCAHGSDRPALANLGALMAAVATDGARVRKLVKLAKSAGFEFDD